MQKAKALQISDPLLSIKILSKNVAQPQNISRKKLFDSHVLLIELLIKTEQYEQAEKPLNKLVEEFSTEETYQPRLAILKSHLMLSQQDSNDIISTLAPFADRLKNEEETELHSWYLYIMGAYHVRKYQFENALKYLNLALDKARNHQMLNLELTTQNQLLQVLYYTKKYERGIKLADKLIELSLKINDQYFEVSALSDKMNMYYMLAVELYNSLEHETAKKNINYLSYMEKSNQLQQEVVTLSEKIGANRTMISALIIGQNNALYNHDFKKSIAIGEQILNIANQNKLEYESAIASNNMSIAYRQIGEFDKSIEKLKIAERYYQKIQDVQSQTWVNEDYAITYELANQFEKALNYYQKYHKAYIAYINKTKDKSLLDLQEKYAAKEKSQEIEKLTHQSLINAQQLKNEKMGRWLLTMVL